MGETQVLPLEGPRVRGVTASTLGKLPVQWEGQGACSELTRTCWRGPASDGETAPAQIPPSERQCDEVEKSWYRSQANPICDPRESYLTPPNCNFLICKIGT